MNLPIYSEEQFNVIKNLENNNTVVDSVAGSGKTTCNLHIAKYFSSKHVLLLTYNAKLKIETRDRVKQLGLTNIMVQNYHSFCVKYYDNKCFNDSNMILVLKKNIKPQSLFNFDIIIVDEAQDITSIFYELICKIYKDNMTPNAKICIMGDRYQSIYDFMNADERYILYAEKLFNFNKIGWSNSTLSQSFRITNTMADFINNVMIKENRIVSYKNSLCKPRYIICDTFEENNNELRTLTEIKYYLNLGYKPDDIFILSPSVKSVKLPVRVLENHIKTKLKNIPIYVPTSDDEKLDLDILKNKLVFSTFHQAKGLERKVVIIFNFDNSYFKFFKKDAPQHICPNEFYVACTRALEHMTVFHHYRDDYLPFLDTSKLKNYCSIEINKKLKVNNRNDEKEIKVAVTDIIKHLPSDILDKCYDFLTIKNIRKKGDMLNIPIKTEQLHGYEGVSEITGTAIPCYYEYKIKNKISILYELILVDDDSNSVCDFIESKYNLNDIYKKLNNNNISEDEVLYISNRWCAYKSGYIFKKTQITNYDWLSKDNMNKCIERLFSLNISKECMFEYKITAKNQTETLNRAVNGFIDCIDKNNVYEFKCVDELTKEHYLQLALYMYMYNILLTESPSLNKGDNILYKSVDNMGITMQGKIHSLYKNGRIDIINIMNIKEQIRKDDITKIIPNINYYLYNILTDELNSIIYNDNITKMVCTLIDYKYKNKSKKTDDVFIEETTIIRNKLFIG